MMFKKHLFPTLTLLIFSLLLGGCTGEIPHVEPPVDVLPTPSIRLNEENVTLNVNDTYQIQSYVYNTNKYPSFTSSDKTILEVTQGGLVTALKEGRASVTISVDDIQKNCYFVVYKNTYSPSIFLNVNNLELYVGDKYVVTASLSYKNEEPIENVNFNFAVDADSTPSLIGLSKKSKNSAEIVANRVGDIKLTVSCSYGGNTIINKLNIRINPRCDLTYRINNMEMVRGGYAVNISSKSYKDLCSDSIIPDIEFFYQGEKINSPSLSYVSKNSKIAYFDGEKIKALTYGETDIVATCSYKGEEAIINIHVDVSLPYIPVERSEELLLEVTNPSTYSFALNDDEKALILGDKSTIQFVRMGNKYVGYYDKDESLIKFDSEFLPTFAKDMGNQKLILETEEACYMFDIFVCTKVIKTATDFDLMGSLAKNAVPAALKEKEEYSIYTHDIIPLWDGYFVLGNDIVYNGDDIKNKKAYNSPADSVDVWQYQETGTYWQNGHMYGFRGVFDGRGFNIHGLKINENGQSGGIFGVLNIDGVIKNVSFTNAILGRASGFVCSAGAGRVENIYIKYSSIGEGTNPQNRSYGSVYPVQCDSAAIVSNCYFDVYNAVIDHPEEFFISGLYNTYKGTNIYSLTNNDTILSKSLSPNYTYDSFFTLANADVQLSNNGWHLINGIPFFGHADEIYNKTEIIVFNAPAILIGGTSIDIVTNMQYFSLIPLDDYEGIEFKDNHIKIGENIKSGTIVNYRAFSLLNEDVHVDLSFIVHNILETKDLTNLDKQGYIELHSLDADFSEFSDYPALVGEKPICYLNENKQAIELSDLETGNVTVTVVFDEVAYVINCLSADYFIRTKEDFLAMRPTENVAKTGYYALLNDIDFKGDTFKNFTSPAWEASVGFRGIFDGFGHTVSNFKLVGTSAQNGIFISLGTDAVIQNVKFTHITTEYDYRMCVLSLYAFGCTVSNVDIQIDELIVTATSYVDSSSLLVGRCCQNAHFNNINVDASGISLPDTMFMLCQAFENNSSFQDSTIKLDSYKMVFKDDTNLPNGIEYIKG